jgi:hypothetical protein
MHGYGMVWYGMCYREEVKALRRESLFFRAQREAEGKSSVLLSQLNHQHAAAATGHGGHHVSGSSGGHSMHHHHQQQRVCAYSSNALSFYST